MEKKESTTIDLMIFDRNWSKLTKKEKQTRKNAEKKLKQILGDYQKDVCLEFILS